MFLPIANSDVKKYKIKEKPLCIKVRYTYYRDETLIPTMDCYTPPVGWVYDYVTKEWRHTGVHERSKSKSECYWEVDPRFQQYKKWKKEEDKRRQEEKSAGQKQEYEHPDLKKFISDCWLNRLSGFWFSNNGVPTYLTGQHWFYLSCFHLDIGLPKYREVDADLFYLWEYCTEDPDSYGLILLTKRRNGKTFCGGCLAVELTTRQDRFRTGIQSKTDDDAFKVYEEHIVFPFKAIPYFFKPTKINLPNGGKTPKGGLKFNSGLLEEGEEGDSEELQSVIDYRASGVLAYDGWKMKFYFADETGKTTMVDVYKRWNTVKKCLVDDDYKIIGKSLQTTTVEDMEKGGSQFLELWKNSDQGKKKEGKTQTGLYKLFVPAFRTINIDKYGKCDEQANKKKLESLRELQEDTREKSIEIRQNPFCEEEAFRKDGDDCVFDTEKLYQRDDELKWIPQQYEKGNLEWKDGVFDSEVVFTPNNHNGRFMIKEHPPEGRANAQLKVGKLLIPDNIDLFAGGIDPFDYKMLEEGSKKKMSLGSITIIKRENAMCSTEIDGGPACFYLYRAGPPNDFYEDVLKCLKYYGCFGIVETNKSKCMDYLEDNGYDTYVPFLPGSNKRGINNAGTDSINRQIAEVTAQFIFSKLHTVFFPKLIDQWLNFDPADTTKSDGAMSFGYAKMLDRNALLKAKSVKKNELKSISDFFSFARKTSYRVNKV